MILKPVLNELNLTIGFGKVIVYKYMLDCNNIEDSNYTKENITMEQKSYVIIDETGIHARPCYNASSNCIKI